MDYIRFPQEIDLGEGCGRKAEALAELSKAGFAVPPFFVVLPEGFHASLTPEQQRAWENAQDPEDFQALLEEVQVHQELQANLQQAILRLDPDSVLVSVRSSAQEEDSADSSFAGQLASFLFVTADQVSEKILAVWRSGFSERLFAYRKERGLTSKPEPPGVVIQRMITPDTSGVAFGADPVSGSRSITVIGAIFGPGTALVSGDCDTDTFHVNQQGEIFRRQSACKRYQHVMDPNSEEGVRLVEVDTSKQNEPALSDDQVLAVAAIVRQTGLHFGCPQDIEWAYEGGNLYLLQSRPITTLANTADPDAMLSIWDNSNIAESYGGMTTPLTFSFARRAYEAVYLEFCRILKVPESRISRHAPVFANMIGLIQGRIYYNLLNWYRVLALLPGFQVNRRFMEQMMGVQEDLPEEIVLQSHTPTAKDRMIDSLGLAKTALGLLINHFLLSKKTGRFYERLNQSLAEVHPPLESQRPDQLAFYYQELEGQLLRKWDAPLINDFFAMIFYGVLRTLTAKWCGDANGTLQNDLLCGQGGMISTEPVRRIREMAELISSDTEFIDILCRPSLEPIQARLAKSSEFEREYRDYLAKFGDRCMEELKLESDTLQDDPLVLLRSIGQYARRLPAEEGRPSRNREGEFRAQAEERLRQSLSGHPLRRLLYYWVLRHARNRIRDRENLRFERTRVFGRVRRIFVEMGKRFYESGVLENPKEIFYLELQEILGFVQGSATTTRLSALAKLRQTEFDTLAKAPAPPGRLETRGVVYQGNPFHFEATPTAKGDAGGDQREGIGCCPGIVQGVVRVISDPKLARLSYGEILVAERTDPGWILLFPSAAGLLVERGSLLSHAAIVSREMGIPSVVSIRGLTSWLKDGDRVELNGSSGIVRRLPDVPGAAR